MKTQNPTRKNWSREELILAFNLYCKTPFGRIYTRNPEIIALAKAIGRTPSSVAWKLANFARLDPTSRSVTSRALHMAANKKLKSGRNLAKIGTISLMRVRNY